MKKVVNINLGGYPFTIDDDAYEALSQYLNTIKMHFRDSEGRDEILEDIESGMADLFREKLAAAQIVTMKEVNEAIKVMGTPEEFGAEIPEEQPTPMAAKSSSSSKRKSNYRTGKRLYRDPNDEVIGGVAAGLAAYFGVQEPLWIRIALAVSVFIGFGTPVIAYIILWIVLPKAETAADRLAMRGEAINANNIGRVVEEELDKFGKRVDEWGNEVNDKFASAKKKVLKSKTSGEKFGQPLRKGFMF